MIRPASLLRPVVLAVSLAGLTTSFPARAGDAAAAQELFDQAKRLMSEGKYKEACVRFEESQRQDPGIGTLYNLADCFERSGKLASAWAAFRDVESQARALHQNDRADVAAGRAATLQPKLQRLVIKVPPQWNEASGVRIERNGAGVGPGQWGSSTPVDPGEQTITASAPGKKTWRTVITIAPESSATPTIVTVPELELEPEEKVASPATPAPSPPLAPAESPAAGEDAGSGMRVLGLVVGGVGLAGIGLGSVFGMLSIGKHDDAAAHCGANNRCNATGVALRDDALTNGNVSTVAFIAGAALLVGGAVLYFTAPRKRSTGAVTVSPMVGGATGGLSLRGAF